MGLGIRAHDVQIFDDTPRLIERLQELGFDHIQYAPRVSLKKTTRDGRELTADLAQETGACFKQAGIRISVLGCYVNIIDPDLDKRELAIQQFSHYLEYQHSFQAKLVGTETGSVDPNFNLTRENYTADNIALTIGQIKKMVQAAEKISGIVGIEPGVNHPIHSLAVTKQMIDEVDSERLRIILDAGNLVTSENDDIAAIIDQAINLFGDKIDVFHLKEYVVHGGHAQVVPVGEGVANLGPAYQMIRSKKPAADIIWDEVMPAGFDRSIKRIHELSL